MSCHADSIASATMVCLPVPPAKPASIGLANCWRSYQQSMMTRRRNRSTRDRHASAVGGAWSSSRPLPDGTNRGRSLQASPQPGEQRRDPARPNLQCPAAPAPRATGPFAPASVIIAITGLGVGRLQRRRCPIQSHDSLSTPGRNGPQTLSRQPKGQPKTEIPMALHLRPAGSFLGDFRTPIGALNSSRERNSRL